MATVSWVSFHSSRSSGSASAARSWVSDRRPQPEALRVAAGGDEALGFQGVQQPVERGTAQAHPLQQLAGGELRVLARERQQDVQRPVHRAHAVAAFFRLFFEFGAVAVFHFQSPLHVVGRAALPKSTAWRAGDRARRSGLLRSIKLSV